MRLLLPSLLLGLLLSRAALAQETAAPAPAAPEPAAAETGVAPVPLPAGHKFTVVAKPAPPFVIANGSEVSGLSIDLWARVAQELKYPFEVKVVPTVPQLMEAVQNKQADAGLGAITINSQREALIDFSHPFYDSGLQILVQKQGKSSMFSAFKSVVPDLLKVVAILLFALLINAHLLWFFERGEDSESFPNKYPFGVWQAAWWSICTLITGGCENIAPARVRGRLLAIIWMLTGFGLVSFVTARMASIMTVNTLTSEIRSLADLRGLEVGSISGSAGEAFLKQEPVKVRGFSDVAAAAAALTAGDVKAVVYDAPILRYYLAQNPDAPLQLVGSQFEKQRYGIALQQASPYRKEINRVLLRLGETGFFDELDRKWFGEEKKSDEGGAEK